jgi:predicted transcriptional regulator
MNEVGLFWSMSPNHHGCKTIIDLNHIWLFMPKGTNPAIERQILQIIYSSGGTAGFTVIWESSKRSKSTIAKYLADCERGGLVERSKLGGQGKDKYSLTSAGEARLQEEAQMRETAPIPHNGPMAEANKKGIRILPGVSPLVNFYKRIFVEEGLIWRIALLYSRFGERVAQLAPIGGNPELYWTVFYIFVDSTENADTLAMNLREFCLQYGLKQLSLEYYIDKILSLDVGLHRVKRGVVDCFYLDLDEVGTLIRQLADDKLDQFFFRREMSQVIKTPGGKGEEKLPLHEFTEIIIRKLRAQNLISESWRDPFTVEVQAHIVRRALERGLPADLLPPKATPEVETYLAHVEDMRGFCAACGNWIQRSMRECPRCQAPIDKESALVTDFRIARDLTRKYKEKQALEARNCPQCGSRLPSGEEMEICPTCGNPLVTLEEDLEKKKKAEEKSTGKAAGVLPQKKIK